MFIYMQFKDENVNLSQEVVMSQFSQKLLYFMDLGVNHTKS